MLGWGKGENDALQRRRRSSMIKGKKGREHVDGKIEGKSQE